MDAFTVIIISILLLLPALLVLYVSLQKPYISGPALREYLPGGLVYPMFRDARTFCRVLDTLSERYGDVFHVWIGPSRHVVTCLPADIAHIFKSPTVFSRTSGLVANFEAIAPGGIFSMPLALHRVVRKKLKDNFKHSMLAGFQSQMQEAVQELCDSLADVAAKTGADEQGPVIDIAPYVSVATFRVITNVAFGSSMGRTERLEFAKTTNNLVDEMMADFMGYPVRQMLTMFGVRNRLFKCRRKIRDICALFIRRRLDDKSQQKQKQGPNILDVILELDECDAEVAVSLTSEFALAGTHSTSQALAWCMYETCCNPRVASEVEKELSDVLDDRALSEPITLDDMPRLPYITNVWREVLRLHPLGAGALRETTEEVTLAGSGIHLAKGTIVLGHQRRAMKHESLWTDPLDFKPERWSSEAKAGEANEAPAGVYVPFAAGQYSCVGRFLADYEGPLILAELHRRFRFVLGCQPDEVVSCTAFIESAKYASVKGGDFDMGVPLRVQFRSSS